MYLYDEEEGFFCKRLFENDEMGEEMTAPDVIDELNTLQSELAALKQNIKEVGRLIRCDERWLAKRKGYKAEYNAVKRIAEIIKRNFPELEDK